MKSFGFLSTLACGVFLQGCANTELPRPPDLPSFGDLPFVHKIDIQQGNVITQEMIAQLQYGMDKKKVNFVMGSPIIQDTFHANRWDYLYTINRNGGKTKRRRITLYFEEDHLVRVEGDVKPAAGRLVVDTRQDMTVDVPEAPPDGLIDKLKNTIPFVGEEKPPQKPTETPTVARVVDEDDTVQTEAKKPTQPTLTPVQRAALEEQGGPGMLAKLKGAMPFSGDAAADSDEVTQPASTQAEDAPPATVADAEASPGLLAKLKGAMPFTGDEPATDTDTTESAAEAPDDDAIPEEVAPAYSEVDDDAADSVTDEYAQDEAGLEQEARDPEQVVVAPPIAPTSMPLENQLTGDSAPPRASDTDEVDVPAEKTSKKRGFFARLFGRDRPEPTAEPDEREQRRYRDLADPDVN